MAQAIEDPIEFVHQHKNCIVNQREVGLDSDGWDDALKDTLRQAPDVILMGEIRDRYRPGGRRTTRCLAWLAAHRPKRL